MRSHMKTHQCGRYFRCLLFGKPEIAVELCIGPDLFEECIIEELNGTFHDFSMANNV